MASGLSAEQEEELGAAFTLFDKNGDGGVSAKELGAIMRSLGHPLTDNELLQIISEAPPSKNAASDKPESEEKTLDRTQFLEMMAKRMNVEDSKEEEIKAVFKQFDKNNDGVISAAELRYVMNVMGESPSEQDIEKMMEAAGAKNGFIDETMFENLIKKVNLYNE